MGVAKKIIRLVPARIESGRGKQGILSFGGQFQKGLLDAAP